MRSGVAAGFATAATTSALATASWLTASLAAAAQPTASIATPTEPGAAALTAAALPHAAAATGLPARAMCVNHLSL